MIKLKVSFCSAGCSHVFQAIKYTTSFSWARCFHRCVAQCVATYILHYSQCCLGQILKSNLQHKCTWQGWISRAGVVYHSSFSFYHNCSIALIQMQRRSKYWLDFLFFSYLYNIKRKYEVFIPWCGCDKYYRLSHTWLFYLYCTMQHIMLNYSIVTCC